MSTELDTAQSTQDTPDPISTVTVQDLDADSVPIPSASDTPERWSRLPKARGRQPRDPLGQSVRLQCRDIDDLKNLLHDYLQAPTIPAEHATIEFVFPGSSAFMVYTADLKSSKTAPLSEKQQHLYNKLNCTAISVTNALVPGDDAKDRMRKQKAIAKVCVEACEKADGFRYSFHNNWLSKEDEACRFSYFCNDSTLNKGRAANEAAGMEGKRMRKPVYNCQGLIAVKFSSIKQSLEVHYKHIPLHKTYAERAPPPRRDSKRRKLMELFDPESLPAGRNKRKAVALEDGSMDQSRNRPVVDPASNEVISPSRQAPRETTLHPLVEFLGSATTETASPTSQRLNHGTLQPQARTESALTATTASPIIAPVLSGAPKSSSTTARRAPIPGTMSFSMHNKRRNPDRQTNTHATPSQNDDTNVSSSNTLLSGISDAAAVDTTSSAQDITADFPLSELVALKRKLEEAEERIRKLESEKTAPLLAHLPPIPQHVLWPPPPGYPSPTHIYPYQQAYYPPPQQKHFQQPQQQPHQQPQQQPHQQYSPPPPSAAASAPSSSATAAAEEPATQRVPPAPRSMSSGQNRFRLPPQRPFGSAAERSDDSPNDSASTRATKTALHVASSTPPPVTSKPSGKRQMGRRFVPYKPGQKQKHATSQVQPPQGEGLSQLAEQGTASNTQSEAEN